jgi:hypothetical protein
VAELVTYTLDDGSEVYFEPAKSDLIERHVSRPEVADSCRSHTRVAAVAEVAQ